MYKTQIGTLPIWYIQNFVGGIDEILDEDQQGEIHEYFLEAKNDKIDIVIEEFDGYYDDEKLRLYRNKVISEVAN